MKDAPREMRMFELMRDEDISGVSGIGRVAVGVVFPSDKVVLEWLGSHRTFGIYDSLADVERIHGHGGKTRVVFSRRAPFIPFLEQVNRPSMAVDNFLTTRAGYRMKIRAFLEFAHEQVRRRFRLQRAAVHDVPGTGPATVGSRNLVSEESGIKRISARSLSSASPKPKGVPKQAHAGGTDLPAPCRPVIRTFDSNRASGSFRHGLRLNASSVRHPFFLRWKF